MEHAIEESSPEATIGWPSTADADLRARQELLLDEGLMETFPASDPVAIVRLT